LRGVYGSVTKQRNRRIRTEEEQRELHETHDLVADIIKTNQIRVVKKMSENNPESRENVEISRLGWWKK
jgi:hypothetical protein